MTRGQVVWLLWDDLWGDDRMLWGVYSTRDLAEAAATKPMEGPYSPVVEACELDAGPAGREGALPW